MKIAMLTEYFWPHDLGGSEWSTYYLALEIIKNGHQVVVITPNYGAKKDEFLKNIKIIRFPFFKKAKNYQSISPFWHTGLLWQVISTVYLLRICKRELPDIIHVQGKYYSPAAFIVKLMLRIPTIMTVRDYQLICNYGFCIWKKNKACGLAEYFTKEFPYYIKNYLKNCSKFSIILNFLFAINARFIKYYYSFFAKRLNLLVCISNAQSEIYRRNGYKKIRVIYNPMPFSKKKKINNPKEQIVYAGRLTPGKGASLLFESLPLVFKNIKNLRVLIIGSGFLRDELNKTAHKFRFTKNVDFLGHLKHNRLLKIYSQSRLTIVPSLWQEPFGRVALESLSAGTPVVVTNRGGLKEIVDNSVTGYVTKANPQSLSKAIIKAINENSTLRANIDQNYTVLKNKFQEENVKQYIKIYESLK